MTERWYILWRKHEQRSEKIIIPVPPIDAKHMDHEDCCNPNQQRYFSITLLTKAQDQGFDNNK
jgi:hypothetical protein